MLILFDIDQTLISTDGAGMKAMIEAGRRLFGPGFHSDGVHYAGRLDPLIIADLFAVNAVEATRERLSLFRDVYAACLAETLAVSRKRVLPGVPSLLGELRRRDEVVLGLLTGNLEETGRMKLAACGVDASCFRLGAWGDESPNATPDRADLVPIASTKYAQLYRRSPEAVVVIGDTPHDVRCARAHGARSLGVATGYSTEEQLAMAGADLVVNDLSDTGRVVNWLLGAPGRRTMA